MGKASRAGQASVLTPDQLLDLWAELDQSYRLVTQISYFTAARCGEVVSLEGSDLQSDRIIYRAPKTKTRTTREAVLSAQLRAALAEVALPPAGYLFPSAAVSGHLTVRAVDKQLRLAAALLGFEGVSTHTFRRSLATHLHLKGVSLRSIQRCTGHATLAALERYLDISGLEAATQQQQVLNALFPAG